jgi:inner membrane protein
LAGAVVVDSLFHFSGGVPLIGGPFPPSPDDIALKVVYYGFAALGALVPDIDNARSTIGKRAGFVSRGFQALAGHRTIFHSLIGLFLVGAFIWGAQYALGLGLYNLGLHRAGAALGAGVGPGINLASGRGVAFAGLMVGYFLHLVADSLTLGGVPWLWPSHVRYGFPPVRKWRFKSGSRREPIVVAAVCVLVLAGIFTHYLAF